MAATAPPKPASWPQTATEPARPPGPWDHLPEVAGGEPEPPKTVGNTFAFEGAWKPPTGAFGLKTDNAPAGEPVSAFDRPQPVIVVGPNPLPVSFDFSKIGGKEGSPTVPRGERGERGEGGAMGMARAIGARFLAVLAPLYALSTILNQTNSGMGVFGKAVNVLGATLAPILLPVFAILAATVLSVSDIIAGKLIPALGEFYDWVLKVAVPFAEKKVEQAGEGVDAWVATKNLVTQGKMPEGKHLDTILRNSLPGGEQASDLSKFLNQKILQLGAWGSRQVGKDDTPWKNAMQLPMAGGKIENKAPEEAKPNFGQMFSANMRDVLKSLAMSVGPKASYSSLGEAGKQAQLAALNADPIEMKAAQRVIASIEEFQRAFERYSAKEQPKEQINRK